MPLLSTYIYLLGGGTGLAVARWPPSKGSDRPAPKDHFRQSGRRLTFAQFPIIRLREGSADAPIFVRTTGTRTSRNDGRRVRRRGAVPAVAVRRCGRGRRERDRRDGCARRNRRPAAGSSGQVDDGSARFSESDPSDDDSDDDDDGDDAGPGGPAAAADAAALVGDSGEGAVMTSDIPLGSLRPLAGYSLRGPPRVESDDTSIDFDDDDDDSSECSHGRATARQFQPLNLFASHSEPARRRVPDGPQLRAP